ncbi:MAG: GNAT family N-acetyltransferase [Oscillospiraceae bacterium]|nr:GNAT family N-acetyltransferase [Oscillospiraceae bacterium]
MTSINIIYPGDDFSEAMKIRIPVFVEEQGVPQENELDDNDKISYHVLLYENEIPVACGRLYLTNKTAHIGRVAVLKKYRRKGYATIVCKSLINLAVSLKKADIITLDAQTYVVELYKKLGFKVVGDEFLEENIPHFKMILEI